MASRAQLGKYLMGVDIDKKILNCNMMTIEFNNKTLLTSIKLTFSKAQLILVKDNAQPRGLLKNYYF